MHLLNRKPFLALLLVVMLGCSFAFAQDGPATVNFSLHTADGQTITSDSLRGEVVVLAFGASWLPLSKAQLQGVRKLADEYSDRGVVVYWVSTESEDPKSKNFGVDQLPSFVIIDKQGTPTEPIGGLDPNGNLANQLASRLDKVL